MNNKNYPLHHDHVTVNVQRDVFYQLKIDAQNLKLQNEALKRKTQELKEMQRWRKFSEEKPEHHQWIIVFCPEPSRFTHTIEIRRWDAGCKFDVEEQEIYTHWMPLPNKPEDN